MRRGPKRGTITIDKQDIVGKCLGKLEVISYAGMHYDTTRGGERLRHYYNVQCECGTCKQIRRDALIEEIVHSCGCMRGGRRHGN